MIPVNWNNAPGDAPLPAPEASPEMPETFVFAGDRPADVVTEFEPEKDRLFVGSEDFTLTVRSVEQGHDLFVTVEACDRKGMLATWQTLLLLGARREDVENALS